MTNKLSSFVLSLIIFTFMIHPILLHAIVTDKNGENKQIFVESVTNRVIIGNANGGGIVNDDITINELRKVTITSTINCGA
jgi:hypothetical protein